MRIHTYALPHSPHRVARVALGFMLAMVSVFMFATAAYAKEGGAKGGGLGGEQNFMQRTAPAQSASALESRLKSIEDMRARVQNLLTQFKSGSTTVGTSTRGHDDRDGHHAKGCEIGAAATSTVTTGTTTLVSKHKGKKERCDDKKMRGNERLQVTNPNGGSRVVNDVKKGILIRWKAPQALTTVDIDVIQEGASSTASSSTSIAKAIDAHAKAGRGGKGGNRSQGSYLWRNAPLGTGYKIVVTGTNGTTILTDMSDKTFSIVAKRSEKSSSDDN